jgi:hypothetical protein
MVLLICLIAGVELRLSHNKAVDTVAGVIVFNAFIMALIAGRLPGCWRFGRQWYEKVLREYKDPFQSDDSGISNRPDDGSKLPGTTGQ